MLYNIKIDTKQLYGKFIGDTSSNIEVIKCYYLLFIKENILKNIGSYILLFIILLYILFMIIFIIKGYKSLKKFYGILKKNYQNKK